MLKGKKILLGVCGSIAAYKSAFLVRLLVKEGAEVRVVMTESATHFITPLTLATLSKNPVVQYFERERGEWNNHVELGLWADLFLIAPASANTLAAFANGLCENLLSAVYLSARCPVYLAPAMDLDMWKHPATQNNIDKLQSYGNHLISVEKGELASGLSGEGRMAEPENILEFIQEASKKKSKALNKDFYPQKILITAGPTREAIDPVRYISNHSSGKMGLELAKAALERGATVDLIIGPNNLEIPKEINVHAVTSTLEMFEKAKSLFDQCTVGIFAAAVSDYRPAQMADKKIKKKDEQLNLELVKNPDILKTLGQQKKQGQIIVGFALETDNEADNARQKLKAKNLDLIILNSLKDKGAGFEHDTNKIAIIDRAGETVTYPLQSKTKVANNILDAILNLEK